MYSTGDYTYLVVVFLFNQELDAGRPEEAQHHNLKWITKSSTSWDNVVYRVTLQFTLQNIIWCVLLIFVAETLVLKHTKANCSQTKLDFNSQA